jgi:hypothetical protein
MKKLLVLLITKSCQGVANTTISAIGYGIFAQINDLYPLFFSVQGKRRKLKNNLDHCKMN